MSLLLALTAGGVAYADNLSDGVYLISGKSVSDSVARSDNVASGSYSIAGKDITDALVPAAGTNYADNLNAGSYVIVGQDITDQHFTPSHGWVDRHDPGPRKKKKKKRDTLRETIQTQFEDELEQAHFAIRKIAYPDEAQLETLSAQTEKLIAEVEKTIIYDDEEVLLLLLG